MKQKLTFLSLLLAIIFFVFTISTSASSGIYLFLQGSDVDANGNYIPRHSLPVNSINPPPKSLLFWADQAVLEGLLKVGLSNFYHRADTYHWVPECCGKTTPLTKSCQVVYGFLVPEDFWKYVPENYRYSYQNIPPDLKKVVFTIIRSEKLRKITYSWVKPHYQEAFLNLTPDSQKVYIEALEYAKTYLETFDYKKEKQYLLKNREKNLKNGVEHNDPDRGFAYADPEGNWHHFRKIEAFCFRRVHNKDMTLAELKKWTNILLIDAQSTLQQG